MYRVPPRHTSGARQPRSHAHGAGAGLSAAETPARRPAPAPRPLPPEHATDLERTSVMMQPSTSTSSTASTTSCETICASPYGCTRSGVKGATNGRAPTKSSGRPHAAANHHRIACTAAKGPERLRSIRSRAMVVYSTRTWARKNCTTSAVGRGVGGRRAAGGGEVVRGRGGGGPKCQASPRGAPQKEHKRVKITCLAFRCAKATQRGLVVVGGAWHKASVSDCLWPLAFGGAFWPLATAHGGGGGLGGWHEVVLLSAAGGAYGPLATYCCPQTPSLCRWRCPSASHPPVLSLSLPGLSSPPYSHFLALGLCHPPVLPPRGCRRSVSCTEICKPWDCIGWRYSLQGFACFAAYLTGGGGCLGGFGRILRGWGSGNPPPPWG